MQSRLLGERSFKKPFRFGIVLIFVLIVVFVVTVAFNVKTSDQNTDFSIASFKNGESINENESIKEASSITIDKVDYSLDKEAQEISSLKGVISLNATVLAAKEVKSVTYSTSQSNVTLCSPAEDYSADLNEVILKGRKSITFSESEDISYTLIGIIIESDGKINIKQDEATDREIASDLLNTLESDFLTVEVNYTDGTSANKLYSLSAQIGSRGDLLTYIKETDV